MRRRRLPLTILPLLFLAGCGEPMYANNGSPNSLLQDREACAMEIEQSPTALSYRENPSAHPDYPSQTFEELDLCIEGKGWKHVRSPQEQEQIRDVIASQATQLEMAPSLPIGELQARQAFVRSVEASLVRSSSLAPTGVKSN